MDKEEFYFIGLNHQWGVAQDGYTIHGVIRKKSLTGESISTHLSVGGDGTIIGEDKEPGQIIKPMIKVSGEDGKEILKGIRRAINQVLGDDEQAADKEELERLTADNMWLRGLVQKLVNFLPVGKVIES